VTEAGLSWRRPRRQGGLPETLQAEQGFSLQGQRYICQQRIVPFGIGEMADSFIIAFQTQGRLAGHQACAS